MPVVKRMKEEARAPKAARPTAAVAAPEQAEEAASLSPVTDQAPQRLVAEPQEGVVFAAKLAPEAHQWGVWGLRSPLPPSLL